MNKSATSAMCGLVFGGLLGHLWTCALLPSSGISEADKQGAKAGADEARIRQDRAWDLYQKGFIAKEEFATSVLTASALRTQAALLSRPEIRQYHCLGIFWGCGLGAIAGAVVGGAGAIVRAIKENGPKATAVSGPNSALLAASRPGGPLQ